MRVFSNVGVFLSKLPEMISQERKGGTNERWTNRLFGTVFGRGLVVTSTLGGGKEAIRN